MAVGIWSQPPPAERPLVATAAPARVCTDPAPIWACRDPAVTMVCTEPAATMVFTARGLPACSAVAPPTVYTASERIPACGARATTEKDCTARASTATPCRHIVPPGTEFRRAP